MSHIQKTYNYVDERGDLLFQVCRYDPKDFRQRRPDPEHKGKWLWSLDGVRRVLYRLPQVLAERHLILLVEGEKDVHTAEKLGFVATTMPGGAGKWLPEYTGYLAGVDTVAVLPDHDEPGQKGAEKIALELYGKVTHLKVLTLPHLQEHGDLTDWYTQAKDKKPLSRALINLINDTPDWQPDTNGLPFDKKPGQVRTLHDILAHFQGVKQTKNGSQALCPAHDDQKASLSIAEKDGKVLLTCHAGCRTQDVVSAAGLRMQDLFLKHEPTQLRQLKFVQFWYEVVINEGKENERIELKIDYCLFLEFLQKNGFGLLYHDKQVQIVRVVDNIVSTTAEKGTVNLTIKQFVLESLQQLRQKNVRELMLRRHGTFFCLAFLTSLKPLRLTFYRDTASCCALFFKNGFLEVRKETSRVKTSFKPYTQLKGCIWDTHIQDREYHGRHHPQPQSDTQDSVFSRFLRLVSTEFTGYGDTYEPLKENVTAFHYAFAYLVHDYKDYANARAVVCVDNDSGGFEANGRRGKTIFCEALKYLRRVSVEDGKTLKLENQFLFQTLDLDSQILLIDDAREKFDFSQLYPTITGDMAIERKRDQRFILPFLMSPKLVITTNHAILGNGDSHLDRWFVLPFVRYFSAQYKPADEFGHRLFIEWDDQEWQRFFDCTIACLHTYFTCDKPPLADLETYNENKLKASIPGELMDYFDQYLPCDVPKKIFFQDFKQSYPVYEKATQNWFTARLTTYCKMKGYVINPGYESGRNWKTTKEGEKVEYLMITTG